MKTLIVVLLSLLIGQVSLAEVAVTIYKNDVGLVHDTRDLDFLAGVGKIQFKDVAERIIPTSVNFYSKNAEIIEQKFEYGLSNTNQLLSKFIDNQIQIFTNDGGSFTGKLISASGDVIIKGNDNSLRVIKAGSIFNYHMPTIPDELITEPTLLWTVDSPRGGRSEVEVSYLTEGISWASEYVLVINENNKKCKFTGWVNIDNQCGKDFTNTNFNLMGGEVKIPRDKRQGFARDYSQVSARPGSVFNGFQDESYYNFTHFPLAGETTIFNNQIKQIALFPKADVGFVKTEYRVKWKRGNGQVKVSYLFKNIEKNDLGIPLPGGNVRVYEESKYGVLKFVGGGKIDPSVVDKDIRVKTGYSTEFTCSKNKLNKERTEEGWQETWQVSVRNKNKKKVKVLIPMMFEGEWEIVEATPGWEKVSDQRIWWNKSIGAGKVATINYTVAYAY
ncbi:MAG: hypothetical protein HN356_01780 [Calditrichaeota bacterium]|nr:hypothetical protein [Calditrichota bacterium]MBT7619133.1 hypothetical protein [Calditrichota bacterium]MBT7787754.1 hypothetical protein [Calditrichota bacterium]